MNKSNRERQRRWRQNKISKGMRPVTVMLPAQIKDMIDRHRKETGATIAQIVEAAVLKLLSATPDSVQLVKKNESKQNLETLSPQKIKQMSVDLNAIAARFEKMTGVRADVSCNPKPVTNDDGARKRPPSEGSFATEIYRLVRLLNNMEISADEIALTLNKRKYKTLSGAYEWNAGDVQTVLEDIHHKYGHINPLFSISDAY